MDFLDRYSLYTSLQHPEDFVAEWVLFLKAGENLSNVIIYIYICACHDSLSVFRIST
jgi:hypothetical protein